MEISGRLAFNGGIALVAHGEGRVERDGVARDHAVKEVAQRREMLIACCDAGGVLHLFKVLTDLPRRNLCEFPPAMFLNPSQELLHRVLIGTTRVLVADFAKEKFLRGEDGIGASAMNDGR